MVYGLWFMVYGLWFMVYGLWFMVHGLWFMVYALWFMVDRGLMVYCGSVLVFGEKDRGSGSTSTKDRASVMLARRTSGFEHGDLSILTQSSNNLTLREHIVHSSALLVRFPKVPQRRRPADVRAR